MGDGNNLIFVGLAILIGTSILQAVFRSFGKVLRWVFSAAVMTACMFLLWKGGALEHIDAWLGGLGG